jgi:hypothetical protein
MRASYDLDLLPILERALSSKLDADTFGTVVRQIGYLVRNTRSLAALEALRKLFARPKVPGAQLSELIRAACASAAPELGV